MLCPNATSPAEQPRNEPAFSWARSTRAEATARRLVGRADVCVVMAEVTGDRVYHLVGALCPPGPVEEREPPLEGGEPGSDGSQIERRSAHPVSLSVRTVA